MKVRRLHQIVRGSRLYHWRFYPWIVWALAALFFLVEYVARVSPGVMRKSIMIEFELTGGQFGTLSAMFQIIYLLMQLPVGILADRYGPRRLLVLSVALCALGCYVFAIAESFFQAQLARFFMGFAGSFAFVCALKLAREWFQSTHLGLLSGLTQIMGMIGAAMGNMLLPYALLHYDWRDVMFCIGYVLVVLFFAVYFLVFDHPPGTRKN